MKLTSIIVYVGNFKKTHFSILVLFCKHINRNVCEFTLRFTNITNNIFFDSKTNISLRTNTAIMLGVRRKYEHCCGNLAEILGILT